MIVAPVRLYCEEQGEGMNGFRSHMATFSNAFTAKVFEDGSLSRSFPHPPKKFLKGSPPMSIKQKVSAVLEAPARLEKIAITAVFIALIAVLIAIGSMGMHYAH